jgi:hypothetical protein
MLRPRPFLPQEMPALYTKLITLLETVSNGILLIPSVA